MKTLFLNKLKGAVVGKCNLIFTVYITLFFFCVMAPGSTASAQSVLFDFNTAPLHSPFPITLTESGITAHFTATGDGYSIQDNSAPVFPIGFSGRDIYPSSIFLADLLVKFDQTLTDFSILYSCQELACDDAATMRVTVYKNGGLVGTNTMVAKYPGTWPVDTLGCSFPSGFDSVVVHYDHRPPACTDYGVIFLADDMRVTPLNATAITDRYILMEGSVFPNPVSGSASISFSLLKAGNIHVTIYDINGRLVKELFAGQLNMGQHQYNWNSNDDAVESGVYFLNFTGDNFSRSCKLVVVN